jgi:N-acetyl-1-D-myo-inositol-2-amino-2-deoxy-alpha-D-glucopyranoside deacetylase
MSGGVLAVFSHPDDESLVAGGALAGCAAAGRRVGIVSLTRGERGPLTIREAGRATLAEVREAELQAAAKALGASMAECLDYPDGELAEVEERRPAQDLAAVVERERPEAVIGFSPEGLYWHPDHLATTRFLAAALELVGGEARPAWLYGATWPAGHARRLVSLMRARDLPEDLWGIDPDAFGAPPETITTTIDARPFLRQKLAALRSHRSQLGSEQLFGSLPDDLAEEFLGHEYFVRLAPNHSRGDWLIRALSTPPRSRARARR